MKVRNFISNDVVTCTASGKTSKTCADFNICGNSIIFITVIFKHPGMIILLEVGLIIATIGPLINFVEYSHHRLKRSKKM